MPSVAAGAVGGSNGADAGQKAANQGAAHQVVSWRAQDAARAALLSRKPKRQSLVAKMDVEAEELLAAKDKASLETRIAIFSNVARWVQVRNRLTEDEENSGILYEYKRTLDAAQSALAQREADRIKRLNFEQHGEGYVGSGKRFEGRKQRAARGGTGGDNGGAALDALKARLPEPGLPAADDHSAAGNRGGDRGEISVAVGNSRIVRSELPGHQYTEFDEPRSDGDF